MERPGAEAGQIFLCRSTNSAPCLEETEDTMPVFDIADCINDTCPWSGKPVQADSLIEYHGQVAGFCNPGCHGKFEPGVIPTAGSD